MKIPQFLYHYTDLESLMLILKNRTIRFRPLNRLDDRDESDFENFSAVSKYIFVSSWTEEEKESIPFWNMYTRDMHGVRIKLALNPFKQFRYEGPYPYLIRESETDFYLPYERIREEDYCIFPVKDNSFFYPVQYKEDEEKLYGKLIDTDSGNLSFHLENAGVYKRTAWDFQREWRYKLAAMPVSLNDFSKSEGGELLFERIKAGYGMPLNYIDLEVREECLEAMEIMAGPRMTEGEFEILKMIVGTCLPRAGIIKSRLRIR